MQHAHSTHWTSNGCEAAMLRSRAMPLSHDGSTKGGYHGGRPGGRGRCGGGGGRYGGNAGGRRGAHVFSGSLRAVTSPLPQPQTGSVSEKRLKLLAATGKTPSMRVQVAVAAHQPHSRCWVHSHCSMAVQLSVSSPTSTHGSEISANGKHEMRMSRQLVRPRRDTSASRSRIEELSQALNESRVPSTRNHVDVHVSSRVMCGLACYV